jgi:cohesin domain-containing protein
VAGAFVPASGRTPDDMSPASKGAAPSPSPQPGTATAVPAQSPAGGSATGGLTLSVVLRPATPRVGDDLTVEIGADSAAGVVDAPLHLLYDPARLRFLEATEGDYLRQDGAATVFLVNAQARPGDVVIGIGRTDRSRGAGGRGTLCVVRFEVLDHGATRIAIGSAMAWGSDGSLLPVTTGAAEIQVP